MRPLEAEGRLLVIGGGAPRNFIYFGGVGQGLAARGVSLEICADADAADVGHVAI